MIITLRKIKFQVILQILLLLPIVASANFKFEVYLSENFQSEDTEAPSAPKNLIASQTFGTTTDLSWTESTDNIGVTAYEIYSGTNLIATIDAPAKWYRVTNLENITNYTFTIKARDAAGNISGSSNRVSITTLDSTRPTAPSNLTASELTGTSVLFNWTSSTDNVGVVAYEIKDLYRSWGKTEANINSFKVTGLQQAMTYQFYVIAIDAANNKSSSSNFVSAKALDITPPTTPSNIKVTKATETSISLTWDQSKDLEGTVTYDIYQGGNLLIQSTTSSSAIINNLIPNNSYLFTIKARDDSGNIAASYPILCETVDTLPPSAPTNFMISNITENLAELSWNPSNDNREVVSYNLYYSDGDYSPLSTTKTSMIINVFPGNTYNLNIKAVDGYGNISGKSNTVSFVTAPTPPQYCKSVTSGTNLGGLGTVKFGAMNDFNSNPDYSSVLIKGETYAINITPAWQTTIGFSAGYYVWIDYNGDKIFNYSDEYVWGKYFGDYKEPVVGTFKIPEVVPTGNTTLRVVMDLGGNSGPCNNGEIGYTYGGSRDFIVNIKDAVKNPNAPAPPTALTASNTSWTTTKLTWTASPENTGDLTYEIYEGPTLIGTSNSTSFSVEKLKQATTYLLTVKAKNENGNLSVSSNPILVTTLKATVNPTTPTDLNASETTYHSTVLSWNPSTNASNDVAYRVYRDDALITTVTTNTYLIYDLNGGRKYNFKVQAVDTGKNASDFSNVVSVVTLKDEIAPTVPTDLKATNIATTTATLSWTASEDIAKVEKYHIFQDSKEVGYVYYNTLKYEIKNLKDGTAYKFTVKAEDSSGNLSLESGSVSFTTIAIPRYCIPSGISKENDYITKLELGTIKQTIPISGAYANHSSLSTTLIPGQENTIAVSISKNNSPTIPSSLAVYIDLNGDYDFDDEGELIWSTAVKEAFIPSIKKFTIPLTAKKGSTRMRVVVKPNGIPAACEYISNGQIVDYRIEITKPIIEFEAPSIPTNLTVSNITKTSAILSWNESTDNIAVTGYDIYQGNTLIGSTNLTTYTVNGLNAETAYSFTLKSKDYAKNISDSSDPISFTTSTLSIDEHDSKIDQYILFPNPVIQKLFIKQPNNNTALYKISNLNGQAVLYGHLNENGIEVSHLSSGMYIIELKNEEKTIVKKFIKK
ncbi:fibronectin type III domain-containing protein [Flavobacterium johnsoniae]|uniref:fibronectin type III domain-containing protein n=1 Tax=Flavobacterium johnsoniae TaxID=986 RepID=UPI0025B1A41A|nr:fibronectin type III domain-containing protein [Flavobacterium johnsoniae]WJS95560.1 fibronectin type III domain-containing protein [Flavobacterium johnsoniae]